MKVFSIILGVLMVICGFSCMCTPLMTFMEAGYFLVLLLFIYGVGAIIEAIREKKFGISFLFGIVSIILGIVIMVVPGLKLMTEGLLLYIMAVWFLLQGVVNIFQAFKQKKLENKKWIWMLILGILGALVGIYSLVHPLLMAFTFGILAGVYFIECGINMVVVACSIQSE